MQVRRLCYFKSFKFLLMINFRVKNPGDINITALNKHLRPKPQNLIFLNFSHLNHHSNLSSS